MNLATDETFTHSSSGRTETQKLSDPVPATHIQIFNETIPPRPPPNNHYQFCLNHTSWQIYVTIKWSEQSKPWKSCTDKVVVIKGSSSFHLISVWLHFFQTPKVFSFPQPCNLKLWLSTAEWACDAINPPPSWVRQMPLISLSNWLVRRWLQLHSKVKSIHSLKVHLVEWSRTVHSRHYLQNQGHQNQFSVFTTVWTEEDLFHLQCEAADPVVLAGCYLHMFLFF